MSAHSTPPSLTIMLVDDNEFANMMHHTLLRNFVPEDSIQVFSSPDLALQALETSRRKGEALPDLLLLDIDMPIMNGWELLAEIRRRNMFVRACMLSSSVDPEDHAMMARFQEVLDYISKPLVPAHIPRLLRILPSG